MRACVRACVHACERACERACVRACVRASVRASVRACDLYRCVHIVSVFHGRAVKPRPLRDPQQTTWYDGNYTHQ